MNLKTFLPLSNISLILFLKEKFLEGFLKLSIGSCSNRLILALALPVITRLYSVADFGRFTVFLSVTMICTHFICGRYEYEIIKCKTDSKALTLAILCVSFSSIISLASIVLYSLYICLFNKDIAHQRGVIYLICFSWFVNGLIEALKYFNLYHSNYRRLSAFYALQAILVITLMFSFYFFVFYTSSSWGLILSHVFGNLISSLTLIDRKKFKLNTGYKVLVHRLIKLAYMHRKNLLYLPWSGLLHDLGHHLMIIVFPILFGAHVTGLYGLANRILAAIASFFHQTSYPINFNIINKITGKHMFSYILYWIIIFSSICIIIYVFLFLLKGNLLVLIFGEKWEGSLRFIMYLFPSLWGNIVISPLLCIFITHGKNQLFFKCQAIQCLMAILAILIGYLMNLDAYKMVLLNSFTQSFFLFATMLFIYFFLMKTNLQKDDRCVA